MDLNIGNWLRGFLAGTLAIDALVSGRVFPVVLPFGQEIPALVYRRLSTTVPQHAQGVAGTVIVRIRLHGWDRAHDSALAPLTAFLNAIQQAPIGPGNYPGTASGITYAASRPAPIAFGLSAGFNGAVPAYVQQTAPIITAAPWTASAWVYRSGAQAAYTPIVAVQASTSFGFSLGFAADGVSLGCSVQTASGSVTANSGQAISNTTWTHVAMTVAANGTIALYLNGAQVYTGTGTAGPVPLGGYFTGNLDEIRLYVTTLVGSDVALLAAGGNPQSPPAARWSFDRDLTGSGIVRDSGLAGADAAAVNYADFARYGVQQIQVVDAGDEVYDPEDGSGRYLYGPFLDLAIGYQTTA